MVATLQITILSLLMLHVTPELLFAENCKSVADAVTSDLKEERDAEVVKVLSLNMLRPAKMQSYGHDYPGFECWGTANVWKSAGDPVEKIKFLYTVFDVEIMSDGQSVPISIIGVKYICGDPSLFKEPACD